MFSLFVAQKAPKIFLKNAARGLETHCCYCEMRIPKETVPCLCGENLSWEEDHSVGLRCDTCTVMHVCQRALLCLLCLPLLLSCPLSSSLLFSPPILFLCVAASPHSDCNQQIYVILLISAQAQNPADYVDPEETKALLSHEVRLLVVKDKQSILIF